MLALALARVAAARLSSGIAEWSPTPTGPGVSPPLLTRPPAPFRWPKDPGVREASPDPHPMWPGVRGATNCSLSDSSCLGPRL